MIQVLFLACVALVASSEPAHAWVMVAAVGQLVTAVTAIASTTVGAWALRALAYVAVTALQRARARKKRTSAGLKREATTTGDATPQSFLVGRYATGGNAVCPAMSQGNFKGVPNGYLTYVIDLGDLASGPLDEVYIDGELVPLDGEVHEDYGQGATGRFEGHVWIKYHDGHQTTADPMLLDKFGDYPERPWSADMVGTGVPYVIATVGYDRKVFSGWPRWRFVANGIGLYDPRKDTSVGGVGLHRWDDATTWETSKNPIVASYNVLKGIPLPDGSVWGGSAAFDELPLAVWVAAMNACDPPSVGGGAPIEDGMQIGYEVTLDQEPMEVLDKFMQAASAEYVEVGGVWYVRVGPPALPVYFFTDSDIIRTQERTLDPFPGLKETFNGVHATYPEPAEGWEVKDAPGVYDAEFEAADSGQRLLTDLQFEAVPFLSQVQYLMRAWQLDARRFLQHQVPLPPDALRVNPLDSVSWTSARHGYAAKIFEVDMAIINGRNLIKTLVLRERDSSDYVADPAAQLPVVFPSTGVIAPPMLLVPGFDAQPITVLDGGGTARRPGIRLIWDSAASAFRGLQWRIRIAGQSGYPLTGSTMALSDGREDISAGVLPAQVYFASVKFISDLDTQWSPEIQVLTDDVRLGIADLANEVTAKITDAQARADDAFTRHDAALDGIGGAVGDLVARVQTNVGASALAPVGAPVVPLDTRLAVVAERQQIDLPRLRDSEDGLEAIWEALTSLSAEAFAQNQRLADAGVYVDPTGRVRIMAVVQAEEAVRRAEILVDALAAQVSLSVSHADVSTAVGAVLLNPTQNPLVEDLVTRTTDLEVKLDAESGRIDTLSATLLVGGATMSMTTVSTWLNSLDAAMGQRVTVTEFTDMVARQNGVEILLSALDVPEIAFTVSASRQLLDGDEDLAAAQMADQWDALQNRTVQQQADAAAQRTMRAFVDEGFAAQASETATLVAEVGDQRAAMRVVSKVRVAEGVATAETLQQLQADIGDVQATVTTEATARADADSAQAEQITVLQATTGENTAAICTESTARSDADSAQAQQITVLQATTGENTAAISTESTARSDADSAQAQQITVLQTTTGENTAAISTESTARSDADSAQAQQITALQATTGANTAAVTEEVLARTTANSAVAGKIGVVEAAINPNNEGSIAARLQMIEGAYVTEEEAVAAVETEISASYGDLTALAAATLAAKATADGIQAAYTLRLNGQGVFELISVADGTGGQTVTGKINSDHLRITGTTEMDQAVFQRIAGETAFLQNLTVTQANMGTAAVGTLHIGDNAVSFDLAAESITALLPANGWRNYMGITIPAGYPARVSFAVSVALELTDPLLGQQWSFELRRRSDGVLVVSVGDDVYQGLVSFSGLLGHQPAGSEVYDLYVSFGDGVTLNGGKIIAAVSYK